MPKSLASCFRRPSSVPPPPILEFELRIGFECFGKSRQEQVVAFEVAQVETLQKVKS